MLIQSAVLTALAVSATIAQDFLITSPVVTDWGEWGSYDACPPGSYVYGFQLIAEPDQGFFGDDSALNGINLLCLSPTVRRNSSQFLQQRDPIQRAFKVITSSQGHEGNPLGVFECPDPYFAKGFELRSESDQGFITDDTAANNLNLICENGDVLSGDGGTWGSFTGAQNCPRGLVICGIQTQVESPADVDDTTLNNVRMGCCAKS